MNNSISFKYRYFVINSEKCLDLHELPRLLRTYIIIEKKKSKSLPFLLFILLIFEIIEFEIIINICTYIYMRPIKKGYQKLKRMSRIESNRRYYPISH